jgi:hypothetical protein
MDLPMNRRRWLQALGASGAAAGRGAMNVNLEAAQAPGESSGFESSILAEHVTQDAQTCPRLSTAG